MLHRQLVYSTASTLPQIAQGMCAPAGCLTIVLVTRHVLVLQTSASLEVKFYAELMDVKSAGSLSSCSFASWSTSGLSLSSGRHFLWLFSSCVTAA